MENANQHYVWALSGPVLLLYVAAAAVFFAVLTANLRVIVALTEGAKARTPRVAAAFAAFMSGLSNFIGAATIALLAKTSSTPPRVTMLALPLVLLLERHVHHAVRHPRVRWTHLSALLGGLAGMGAGGWYLLRPESIAEPIARVVLSGEVKTAELDQVIASPEHWAISIQLVVFYCLALVIFFGVHHLLKLHASSMGQDLRDGKKKALATALLAALALNFFGVVAFVMLGEVTKVPIRQAMLLVPVFLIIEAYVKMLRNDRENKAAHWIGLLGSAAGMASAGYWLLRGAKLH